MDRAFRCLIAASLARLRHSPEIRRLSSDAVVDDLQDTGCRSYTFVSTMGLAMEACGEAGKKFDMFDKVNGTDATRLALQAGRPAAEIVAGWKAGKEEFRKARAKYL